MVRYSRGCTYSFPSNQSVIYHPFTSAKISPSQFAGTAGVVSSVFPTGGAMNPTLTFGALALRAAATIDGTLWLTAAGILSSRRSFDFVEEYPHPHQYADRYYDTSDVLGYRKITILDQQDDGRLRELFEYRDILLDTLREYRSQNENYHRRDTVDSTLYY